MECQVEKTELVGSLTGSPLRIRRSEEAGGGAPRQRAGVWFVAKGLGGQLWPFYRVVAINYSKVMSGGGKRIVVCDDRHIPQDVHTGANDQSRPRSVVLRRDKAQA